MSFAEEFKRDREKLKEKLLNPANTIIAEEAMMIVFKEFKRLHKLAPTATHFRVTFHANIKGTVTYNTRLNGEYNIKDFGVNGLTKEILSSTVMLVESCKDDPVESWADCISAREDYDTETEMSVYTFEFFG